MSIVTLLEWMVRMYVCFVVGTSVKLLCIGNSLWRIHLRPALAWLMVHVASLIMKYYEEDDHFHQELIICRGEYLTPHSPVLYDCAAVKRLPFRVTS